MPRFQQLLLPATQLRAKRIVVRRPLFDTPQLLAQGRLAIPQRTDAPFQDFLRLRGTSQIGFVLLALRIQLLPELRNGLLIALGNHLAAGFLAGIALERSLQQLNLLVNRALQLQPGRMERLATRFLFLLRLAKRKQRLVGKLLDHGYVALQRPRRHRQRRIRRCQFVRQLAALARQIRHLVLQNADLTRFAMQIRRQNRLGLRRFQLVDTRFQPGNLLGILGIAHVRKGQQLGIFPPGFLQFLADRCGIRFLYGQIARMEAGFALQLSDPFLQLLAFRPGRLARLLPFDARLFTRLPQRRRIRLRFVQRLPELLRFRRLAAGFRKRLLLELELLVQFLKPLLGSRRYRRKRGIRRIARFVPLALRRRLGRARSFELFLQLRECLLKRCLRIRHLLRQFLGFLLRHSQIGVLLSGILSGTRQPGLESGAFRFRIPKLFLRRAKTAVVRILRKPHLRTQLLGLPCRLLHFIGEALDLTVLLRQLVAKLLLNRTHALVQQQGKLLRRGVLRRRLRVLRQQIANRENPRPFRDLARFLQYGNGIRMQGPDNTLVRKNHQRIHAQKRILARRMPRLPVRRKKIVRKNSPLLRPRQEPCLRNRTELLPVYRRTNPPTGGRCRFCRVSHTSKFLFKCRRLLPCRLSALPSPFHQDLNRWTNPPRPPECLAVRPPFGVISAFSCAAMLNSF